MESTTPYVQADSDCVPTSHRQLPQFLIHGDETYAISSRLHGNNTKETATSWHAPAGSCSATRFNCCDAAVSFPADGVVRTSAPTLGDPHYSSCSTSVHQRTSSGKGRKNSSGDGKEGDCMRGLVGGAATAIPPLQCRGGEFMTTLSAYTSARTFPSVATSVDMQQATNRLQQLQQQQESCIGTTWEHLVPQQDSAGFSSSSGSIVPPGVCTPFSSTAYLMRPPELYQPPIYSAILKKVIPFSRVTCAAAPGAAAGHPFQQQAVTVDASPPALPPPGAVYRAALCSAALLRPRPKHCTDPILAAAAAGGPGRDGEVASKTTGPGTGNCWRREVSAASDSAVTPTASTASCTSFDEECSNDVRRWEGKKIDGDEKCTEPQWQQRPGFYSLQGAKEVHSGISDCINWCCPHKDCRGTPSLDLFSLASPARCSCRLKQQKHVRLHDQREQRSPIFSRRSADCADGILSCMDLTEDDSVRSSKLTRSPAYPLEYQHLPPMQEHQQRMAFIHMRSKLFRQQMPLSSLCCWRCRPSLSDALRCPRSFWGVCVGIAVVLLLLLFLLQRAAEFQIEPDLWEIQQQPAVDLQQTVREHPARLAAARGNPVAAAKSKNSSSGQATAVEKSSSAAAGVRRSTTAATAAAEISPKVSGWSNVLLPATPLIALSAPPVHQQQRASHHPPREAFENLNAAALFNPSGGAAVCSDRSYKPNTLRLAHEQSFFSLFSRAGGISSFEGSDVTAAGNSLYVVFDSSYAIGRTDFSLTPFGHGNHLLYPVDRPDESESDWEAVTVDALTGYLYAIREASELRGNTGTTSGTARTAARADIAAEKADSTVMREVTTAVDTAASIQSRAATPNPVAGTALTAAAGRSVAASGPAMHKAAEEEQEASRTTTKARAAGALAAHNTLRSVPASAAARLSTATTGLRDGAVGPRTLTVTVGQASEKQAAPHGASAPVSLKEETAADAEGARDFSAGAAENLTQEPPRKLLREPSGDDLTAPVAGCAQGGPKASSEAATAAAVTEAAAAEGLADSLRVVGAAHGAPGEVAAARLTPTGTAGIELLESGNTLMSATVEPDTGGFHQAWFSRADAAAAEAAGTAAAEREGWEKGRAARESDHSSSACWWSRIWRKIFPPKTSDGQPTAAPADEKGGRNAAGAPPAAKSAEPASSAATPLGATAPSGNNVDRKAGGGRRNCSRAAALKRVHRRASRKRRGESRTSRDNANDSGEDVARVAANKINSRAPPEFPVHPLPCVTRPELQKEQRSALSTAAAASAAAAQPHPAPPGATAAAQAHTAAYKQETAGSPAVARRDGDGLAGAAKTETRQSGAGETPQVQYHAVVQKIRMQPGGRYMVTESCRTEKLFSHNNKGFEGVASFRDRENTLYLLGLCEGNFCSGGKRGEQRGNGMLILMKREEEVDPYGTTACIWRTVKVIKLPRDIYFRDYSSVALHGRRIAITSQEDSVLWLGELQNVGEGQAEAGVATGTRIVGGNQGGIEAAPTTGEAVQNGGFEQHTVDAWVDETEVKHCESDTTRQEGAEERSKTPNAGIEQTEEELELHRRRGPLLLVDDATKIEVKPGGRILYFPRDSDCNMIYCNIEGITFITDTLLAAASDKVKDYQDHRCIAKEQSLHIFALPPLRKKKAPTPSTGVRTRTA